jgi:tRNA (guanine37-N1)-methyltransferase
MNISVITLFPELYAPFVSASLLKRAQDQGRIACNIVSLFSYSDPKERIDSPTFGHGSGMVIRPSIVEKAIDDQEALQGKAYKIFFSPHGQELDQELLHEIYTEILQRKQLMLLPARYEGMDARVEQFYADRIISVGNFVLMGGDLPAMMFMEAIARLIPGVIGKEESVKRDSFNGPFVDHPEYTSPVVWNGMEVPEVIRSGNHKKIEEWREREAACRTVYSHFQWLRSHKATTEQERVAADCVPIHYVVLMHMDVMLMNQSGEMVVGTTSVTSIDIHDIARSSKTYGIKNFFIVTPLRDQQQIVETLLNFWQKGEGVTYNNQRHQAIKNVMICGSLQEVIEQIKLREGVEPLLVATSARSFEGRAALSYYDQDKVWALKRPVLFVFGTGHGLSKKLLAESDFILPALRGFTTFNHLSVRSAVAVILDRWLGINVKKVD